MIVIQKSDRIYPAVGRTTPGHSKASPWVCIQCIAWMYTKVKMRGIECVEPSNDSTWLNNFTFCNKLVKMTIKRKEIPTFRCAMPNNQCTAGDTFWSISPHPWIGQNNFTVRYGIYWIVHCAKEIVTQVILSSVISRIEPTNISRCIRSSRGPVPFIWMPWSRGNYTELEKAGGKVARIDHLSCPGAGISEANKDPYPGGGYKLGSVSWDGKLTRDKSQDDL